MRGTKVIAIVLLTLGVMIYVYIGYSLLTGSISTPTPTPTPIPTTSSGTPTATKTSTFEQKPQPETGPKESPKATTQSTQGKTTTSSSQLTRTEAAKESPTYETRFFEYRWLKYRVRAGGTEVIYTYENLGEEVVNGKACYHQRVTIEGPQKSEMEVWYDKATGECVKALVSIPGVGKKEIPCSTQGSSGSESGSSADTGSSVPVKGEGLKYVGEETITVPAGTFDCMVFEGRGVKSWVSKQGLLVKWVSGEVEGVLLGYG